MVSMRRGGTLVEQQRTVVGHDECTQRYFDTLTPTYSLSKYEVVLSFLRENARGDSRALDVGCGSGGFLKQVVENTPITNVAGMDISAAYLEQCAGAVPNCSTYLHSILDDDLAASLGSTFDFVFLGAVLHHLVGGTRSASLKFAQRGLVNAWSLVSEGGALIVVEPTFRPHWLMSLVFYVKRTVSSIWPGRLALFGYWNNLGEPIVSYFSHTELLKEVSALPDSRVVLESKRPGRLSRLARIVGVRERMDSVLIVGKCHDDSRPAVS